VVKSVKNRTYKKKVDDEIGMLSANPLPTSEELQKFYAETYYQAPISSSYQESYDQLEISHKKSKCESLIHAINHCANHQLGKFLDIGAGEGFLLNSAEGAGYEVLGLDFSSYGVEKFFPNLSSRHIPGDIFSSLDMLINRKELFSVCASTNVLEHVLDPDLFMKSILNVLSPEGLIAITVPNDYSDIQNLALNESMIDQDFWFVPPHHLHYFNTDSLVKFVESYGLSIVDAFSDFPIDMYLLHSGSNYVKNPSQGREAHRARMLYDLMIVEKYGYEKYLDHYRALFSVGVGRNITVIARTA